MERMMRLLSRIVLAAALVSAPLATPSFAKDAKPAAASTKTFTAFAAASMKNALDAVDAAYAAKSGNKIVASYAASSALAKQLEQGAPAEMFKCPKETRTREFLEKVLHLD